MSMDNCVRWKKRLKQHYSPHQQPGQGADPERAGHSRPPSLRPPGGLWASRWVAEPRGTAQAGTIPKHGHLGASEETNMT